MIVEVRVGLKDCFTNIISETLEIDIPDDTSSQEVEGLLEDEVNKWFYRESYNIFSEIWEKAGGGSQDCLNKAYEEYLECVEFYSDLDELD